MDDRLPNRKSTRLRSYDYAGLGSYFVTVCTVDRWHFFGQVVDGVMRMSDWGELAGEEWPRSLIRRPFITPHAFVVMPNHIHALVSFDSRSTPERDLESMARGMPPESLGRLINGYKGAITTKVRSLIADPAFVVWQRNFHDRIIQDEREFMAVEVYINENPTRWSEDRYNDSRV
jgi:putative transposase